MEKELINLFACFIRIINFEQLQIKMNQAPNNNNIKRGQQPPMYNFNQTHLLNKNQFQRHQIMNMTQDGPMSNPNAGQVEYFTNAPAVPHGSDSQYNSRNRQLQGHYTQPVRFDPYMQDNFSMAANTVQGHNMYINHSPNSAYQQRSKNVMGQQSQNEMKTGAVKSKKGDASKTRSSTKKHIGTSSLTQRSEAASRAMQSARDNYDKAFSYSAREDESLRKLKHKVNDLPSNIKQRPMRTRNIANSPLLTRDPGLLSEQVNDADVYLKESLKYFQEKQDEGEQIRDGEELRTQFQTVSFQNTQRTDVSDGGLTNLAIGGNILATGRYSEEFTELLKYSDQLNSRIDQVKVSSRSQSRYLTKKGAKKTPPRSHKSPSPEKEQPVTPAKPEAELLTHLKYDNVTLQERILQQQEEIENLQNFVKLHLNYQEDEISQVVKEKESALKLLKTRNETELKLQSEILEKNSIIENLTRKLKESTQIILSINLKNQNLTTNYSQKITEKLKLKTEELKAKETERLKKVEEGHGREVEELKGKITQLEAKIHEGDNFKTLYNDSKRKLVEMKDEMLQMSQKNLLLGQRAESLTQLQTDNQEFEAKFENLKRQVLEKDSELQELGKKMTDAQAKHKAAQSTCQSEFDQILSQLKAASQQQLDQKNNEARELLARISELQNQPTDDSAHQVQSLQEELRATGNLKQEAGDKILSMEGTIGVLEAQLQHLDDQAQMDAQQSQNLQSQLSEMAVQLQASDEAIEDVQARNQELESRCADLQQDLEIAQKELEYSKIEQAQLNSVIQNQQTRISALENLDVQKNQKIEEMKQMEEEIREQLENFKAGPSQTSSQRSLREAPEDNRMLLIEENTKLRSKERESTKQISQLTQETDTLRQVQSEKENLQVAELREENARLTEKVKTLTVTLAQEVEKAKKLEEEGKTLKTGHEVESKKQLKQSESQAKLIKNIQQQVKLISIELVAKKQEAEEQQEQIEQLESAKQSVSRQSSIQSMDRSKEIESQYSQKQQELTQQVASLTQEVNTKTFEYNLKVKEVEKLKAKLKEAEEMQQDMEDMAIQIHEEHQQEVQQLEDQVLSQTQRLKNAGASQNQSQDAQSADGRPKEQDHEEQITQLHEQLSEKYTQVQDLELQVQDFEGTFAKLALEKQELEKLIFAMKINLKNLRKVFVGEMKQNVSIQQKFLAMSRSQESLQLDDAQTLMITDQLLAVDQQSDEEVNKANFSVTQEFRNLENEKELVQTAVRELTADQNENNQRLKENQVVLSQNLKASQEKLRKLEAQLQGIEERHASEKQQLLQQLGEHAKCSEKEQKLHQRVEEITLQLVQERQTVQELKMKSNSQSALANLPSASGDKLAFEQAQQKIKEYEQKIQKLEYQSRQSQESLTSFQEALTQEALKRQESEKKIELTVEDNNDLQDDIRQLTIELEVKEDELMKNYQQYQKELRNKDKEIEDLKINMQMVMQAVGSQPSQPHGPEEVSGEQTLQMEQLQEQVNRLRFENEKHSSEFEALRMEKDDIIFDKDIEIKEIQKHVRARNQKIKELQSTVDQTLDKSQFQNNDLGDYFNQDQPFVVNKPSPAASGSRQGAFLVGQSSQSVFKSRVRSSDGDQENDLNIYGDEEDPGLDLDNPHQTELLGNYNTQVQDINKDINRESLDSFGLKRGKTLNQNRLQQSVASLELAKDLQRASASSLFNRNIIQSKLFQDLEATTSKLRADLLVISDLNRSLVQQLELLTKERNTAISDTQSVLSVQEELKSQAAQLATRREEVKKLKDQMRLVFGEKEAKNIMIRQLNIEMENYAEQCLAYEEKVAVLEEAVTQLTTQLAAVLQGGNEKTLLQRKATLQAIKEEEERSRPAQLPSFLMPPPETTSKSRWSRDGSKEGSESKFGASTQKRAILVDSSDEKSDNSRASKSQAFKAKSGLKKKKNGMAMF